MECSLSGVLPSAEEVIMKQMFPSSAAVLEQTRYFGLPNGDVTTDRQYARAQWEIHNLMRNVVSCCVAGKVKQCFRR